MINKFKGKKVAVLGLGIEGVSSALFLQKHGAEVIVLDKKEFFEDEVIKKLNNKAIRTIKGKDYLQNLGQYNMVVRSPGVKLNTAELIQAKQKGIEITSQTKLFFDLCPCPIIGVTGTKGKGTTSSLIYEMLKKQNLDVYLGGNIGVPPIDFLGKLKPHSWVVLELSSFQLQDLQKSPHISILLMTVSEHLDYHKDIYEYIEAKRNILKFQSSKDFAITNIDYPASRESDIHAQAHVFNISREAGVNEGCFIKDKSVWLKINGKEEQIISNSEILLPGEHNLENVCAAVLAATLAGVAKKNIVSVLKTFKGLEHRLELVGIVNGVKYYDDSFSTTPETAIAAIQAFKALEILILGGSSKGSDFTELGKVLSEAKNIKAVIGIGVEWEKMKSQFTIYHLPFTILDGLKNMQEVVKKASEIAEPGDVVILSPACASFDMFKNYKDRGEQFKREVKKLKAETL